MKVPISLSVSPRDPKEKSRALRKAGHVPGVIYGQKIKSTSVKCSMKALHAVYLKAGENTLVEVEVDGKKVPCLIHAISFDPVTSKEEHVDFWVIDMTKKVTAKVPVVLKGESPAVKTEGGVLVTVHSELEVTCLPSDLPESFVVDLSSLEKFHDQITLKALLIPQGVTVKGSPDMVIVTVQEPRKEEEIAPPVAAAVEGAEGAVLPAEGAAAPGAPGAAPAAGTPVAGAPPTAKAPAAAKPGEKGASKEEKGKK